MYKTHTFSRKMTTGSTQRRKSWKTDTSSNSLRRKSDNGWIYPMLDIRSCTILSLPIERETKTPNRFVPDMQISISSAVAGKKNEKKRKKKGEKRRWPGFAGPRTIDIQVNRRDIENFKFFSYQLSIIVDRSKVFHPRRRWKQKPFYGNCSATEQCPTSTSNLFFSLSLSSFFAITTGEWVSPLFCRSNGGGELWMKSFPAIYESVMMQTQWCPFIDDAILCREEDRETEVSIRGKIFTKRRVEVL